MSTASRSRRRRAPSMIGSSLELRDRTPPGPRARRAWRARADRSTLSNITSSRPGTWTLAVHMPRSARVLIDEVDLAPHPRETLTEAAATALRNLILSGQLPPGTPLRLNVLAARLAMSVMPVREALRVLEAERLVTFRAHHGATVAELSMEDVEEAYAVRAALEGLAARDGVLNLTEASLAVIREKFRLMEADAARGDAGPSWATTRSSIGRCIRRAGDPSGRAGSSSCGRAPSVPSPSSIEPGIRSSWPSAPTDPSWMRSRHAMRVPPRHAVGRTPSRPRRGCLKAMRESAASHATKPRRSPRAGADARSPRARATAGTSNGSGPA